MSRFYVPKENITGKLAFIDGQEARHILNVMRLKMGDKVVVFDGTGKEYTGFIKSAKPKSLTLEIVSVTTPKPSELPEITLAQAIPKRERMDYIAEKATELGVRNIIPVMTERTVVIPGAEAMSAKLDRWRRIAVEAAKQSGRSDVPEVRKARKFYDLIYEIDGFDLALMAHLSEDTAPIKDAISDFSAGKIIVFIGPEGDFTPEEITMAKNSKICRFITLGKRTLKSDTAGLYVLSVLNHEFSR